MNAPIGFGPALAAVLIGLTSASNVEAASYGATLNLQITVTDLNLNDGIEAGFDLRDSQSFASAIAYLADGDKRADFGIDVVIDALPVPHLRSTNILRGATGEILVRPDFYSISVNDPNTNPVSSYIEFYVDLELIVRPNTQLVFAGELATASNADPARQTMSHYAVYSGHGCRCTHYFEQTYTTPISQTESFADSFSTGSLPAISGFNLLLFTASEPLVPTPIPEPQTCVLMMAGLAALGISTRRTRRLHDEAAHAISSARHGTSSV